MIVFSPVFDDVTKLLNEWVHEFVSRNPLCVAEVIEGEDATAELLWQAIYRHPGEAVFVASHGCEDAVFDARKEPALKSCETDILLQNRNAYLLSCLAGVTLAKTAVEKGAEAVLAYVKPVVIVIDDRVLDFFRVTLLAPAEGLCMYGDPRRAYQHAINVYRRVLEMLVGRTGVYEEAYTWVKHNMEALTLFTSVGAERVVYQPYLNIAVGTPVLILSLASALATGGKSAS